VNKKIIPLSMIIFVIFIVSFDSGAYDNKTTHRDISGVAVLRSNLEQVLKGNLGLLKA
jgi:hypothetical protein